jgi:RNA-directed DNA polymerase
MLKEPRWSTPRVATTRPTTTPGRSYAVSNRSPNASSAPKRWYESSYFHPQTNDKLERYHRPAKAKAYLFIYHSPEELTEVMASFVKYYNYHRCHEDLGKVTPAEVYFGRREAILSRREEEQQQSLAQRPLANLSTA